MSSENKKHRETYKMKSRVISDTFKGMVKPGWLNECARVSMNKLDVNHVDTTSRANVIKANAFDLLLARYRGE